MRYVAVCAQALAAEVVALEEKSLAVRCRELRLEKELARAKESLQHMQRQLENLTRDRGDLLSRISALQVPLTEQSSRLQCQSPPRTRA